MTPQVRTMNCKEFGELHSGDAFHLDGRLYRKLSKYSAVLLRSASGQEPPIRISRLIHPETDVTEEDLAGNPTMAG